MIRVRFAPSPTGLLHQGNIRTALFNYLYARHQGGQLILRIEDTDQERSEGSYEEAILADLRWLGLEHDEGPDKGGAFGPYRQSDRMETYNKYLSQLTAEGKVYPCFCTHEDLENERRKAMASGKPYLYSGKCRGLSEAERQEKLASGLVSTHRFHVEREIVKFEDLVYGEKVFDTLTIGDFVVARSNGIPIYLFACAVDDALMQITHVIRGEDGMSNTPRQILIQKALGFEGPKWAHLPLILGPDHTLLSKRNGSTPVGILNYLALLGWSPPDGKEIKELSELIGQFELGRVGRSSAVFDWAKLRHVNQAHLRRLPEEIFLEKARAVLAEAGVLGDPEPPNLSATLLALRPNIQTFGDLKIWYGLLYGEPAFESAEAQEVLKTPETKKVLETFSQMLEHQAEELGPESYDKIMEDLKKKTKVKGKKLFMPIRIALTGSHEGPELAALLPSLGKEKVLGRIHRALEGL
jgi:glutamyl-tRNA synthetase